MDPNILPRRLMQEGPRFGASLGYMAKLKTTNSKKNDTLQFFCYVLNILLHVSHLTPPSSSTPLGSVLWSTL